jgi:hypothetical protein
VRQRLPGRVDRHLVGRDQLAQPGRQFVGLPGGRGDRQHRPAGAPLFNVRGQGRRDQRPGGRRCGDIDLVGVDRVRVRQVARPRQGGVGQGRGQQAVQSHRISRARRTAPYRKRQGVWGAAFSLARSARRMP